MPGEREPLVLKEFVVLKDPRVRKARRAQRVQRGSVLKGHKGIKVLKDPMALMVPSDLPVTQERRVMPA